MPWFTNKETGGIFNTDWLADEYKQKYAQIHFNQEMADDLNKQEEEDDFTKELHSILGKPKFDPGLKREADIENRMLDCYHENKINPNWSKGPEYHNNCALCTSALVFQAMGYDVEAMPYDKRHWRGITDLLRPDYTNPDNYMASAAATNIAGSPSVNKHYDWNTGKVTSTWMNYRKPGETNSIRIDNPSITPHGAKAVSKTVIDKVHKWQPGAFGELVVFWKSRGGAHSLFIFNRDGRANIYDGQINKMYDETEFEWFFKSTTANTTSLMRLDNADWCIDNASFMNDLKNMVKRRNSK